MQKDFYPIHQQVRYTCSNKLITAVKSTHPFYGQVVPAWRYQTIKTAKILLLRGFVVINCY